MPHFAIRSEPHSKSINRSNIITMPDVCAHVFGCNSVDCGYNSCACTLSSKYLVRLPVFTSFVCNYSSCCFSLLMVLPLSLPLPLPMSLLPAATAVT